ncbi:MAG: serine/threonine protein kinase, partial [Proteobacteria bacterium]
MSLTTRCSRIGTGCGMIETLIGQRYRLKALIGEGGMASVYSALDEKLERKVAIKILHPHLARNNDIRDRFLLEARTVSGLDHPNILRVYDFSGLESEQLWIVMEILHGEDLSEYVKSFPKNRLQFIVAALITREICRALNEAHKLNIVHRDIKPENIMMLQNGQLKLMDFGIAKVHRANATQTGIFMGSPSYMSPEQIRGTDVDARADIYSLSVLFYEILTGQLPFVGKSTAEVINRIMVGRYSAPNLLINELPPPLTQIIQKGLQHHKDERYQSITEMALALDSFLTSVNFRESRIELEEFSLNRTKFEERIAEVLTVPPMATNALPLDSHEPGFKSRIGRYQASYENPAPANSTVLLDESNLPTLPPSSQDMFSPSAGFPVNSENVSRSTPPKETDDKAAGRENKAKSSSNLATMHGNRCKKRRPTMAPLGITTDWKSISLLPEK